MLFKDVDVNFVRSMFFWGSGMICTTQKKTMCLCSEWIGQLKESLYKSQCCKKHVVFGDFKIHWPDFQNKSIIKFRKMIDTMCQLFRNQILTSFYLFFK